MTSDKEKLDVAKSLVPIFRAMVKSAVYYRHLPATDDGHNECHYCDYCVSHSGPDHHDSDCPIPLIEAWLKEWDNE
jgi:hypothetical protein